MAKPLSEHGRLVLNFIWAHPGVQAQFIEAELGINAKELMIALTILQGRKLIEGKLDVVKFNKWKNTSDTAIRWYPKV